MNDPLKPQQSSQAIPSQTDAREPSLGRGLKSLFGGDVSTIAEPKGMTTLPISRIVPGKYQPRRHFSKEELAELASSIEKHGILHPLLVRLSGGQDHFQNDLYEIIAGERRFRAAKAAGLSRIPVIIRPMSDAQAAEGSLIENIQRQDLNPLEEAVAYKRLAEEFNYTHEDLAAVLGKSRSHVTNMLRLLSLPEKIQNYVLAGDLSFGHCKVLVSTANPIELAERVVREKLSVRALEALVLESDPSRKLSAQKRQNQPKKSTTQPHESVGHVFSDRDYQKLSGIEGEDLNSIESLLEERFQQTVEILFKEDRSGMLAFSFKDAAELDQILQKLMKV